MVLMWFCWIYRCVGVSALGGDDHAGDRGAPARHGHGQRVLQHLILTDRDESP